MLGRRTCLVLEGISGNDTVGFCWQVPVDINTVQMSLLDPEGSGSRRYCRQKHSRKQHTKALQINISLWFACALVEDTDVVLFLGGRFLTSFRCWKLYIITGWPFISIVCHHYVHLVVAIGKEASDNPRGLWIIVGKCFRPHSPVDPQPPQLAAVPPVVNLRDEKQHSERCDSAASTGSLFLATIF